MNRKKQLRASALSGKEMRELSVRKIAVKLMDIMQKHIGNDAAITKERLFKKLFKQDLDDNRVDHWMIWEFTKRAMHKLRRDSNCFLASARAGSTYEYFIVADETDADFYILQLDSSIRKMRSMQKRAQRAVKEKWHQQDWQLDYKPKKQVK